MVHNAHPNNTLRRHETLITYTTFVSCMHLMLVSHEPLHKTCSMMKKCTSKIYYYLWKNPHTNTACFSGYLAGYRSTHYSVICDCFVVGLGMVSIRLSIWQLLIRMHNICCHYYYYYYYYKWKD